LDKQRKVPRYSAKGASEKKFFNKQKKVTRLSHVVAGEKIIT